VAESHRADAEKYPPRFSPESLGVSVSVMSHVSSGDANKEKKKNNPKKTLVRYKKSFIIRLRRTKKKQKKTSKNK